MMARARRLAGRRLSLSLLRRAGEAIGAKPRALSGLPGRIGEAMGEMEGIGMSHKSLDRELQWRAARGESPLSVAEFCARFAALGYRIDRSCDCRSNARYMTGERAGESYPACSTGIVESDTGLRAWNRDARRDSRFQAMQMLRGEIFAVTRDGYILEV